MLFDHALNPRQLRPSKAVVRGQGDRLKPESCFNIVTGHVNVGRLPVFAAVEVKPIWADAHHGWHKRMLAEIPGTSKSLSEKGGLIGHFIGHFIAHLIENQANSVRWPIKWAQSDLFG